MGLQAESANCDRARAWASLRLDGELSELEAALLDSHLRRCAACAALVQTMGQSVFALRAQPLQQLEHPVLVTGRRRIPIRSASVASVAAVVAAVVGVTAVLGTQPTKRPVQPVTRTPIVAADDNDLQQLRTLRVLQLGGRPPLGSGVGQFGAVTSRINGPAL